MIRRWKKWALIALALGAAGFLVAASGLIPIKASSGHWRVTRWVLEFGMARSIATHSLGVNAPESLDTPGLILRGAGAYAINCAPCHGSPAARHPKVTARMTPPPPSLVDTAAEWSDEELFTIIKDGVKFTGMPAWPAPHRPDEVWAVVAFVRQLPEMDEPTYQRLAYGTSRSEPAPGAAAEEDLIVAQSSPSPLVANCARCHGIDGNGRGQPQFPRLAGQRREYLRASLAAYAAGERHSGFMEPVAYGLTPAEQSELAAYYSGLPPAPPSPPTADPAQLERGRLIAHRGSPTERVPSCVDCHGPTRHPRREGYPTLAAQPADYLALQLELFGEGHRGGTAQAHLMHHVAPRLSPEQRDDVAAYFASLAPEPAR